MEFDKTSYNSKAQWEEMQCTRTIALIYLIMELLTFVTLSCPEHNLKTTVWNFIKHHTMVKFNDRKCSNLLNYRVIALCYFFLSRAKLGNYWMEFHNTSYNVKTQWDEVQCTRTITLNLLIMELLSFGTFTCLEHNLKTTGWNFIFTSYNGRAPLVRVLVQLHIVGKNLPLLLKMISSITFLVITFTRRYRFFFVFERLNIHQQNYF